MSSSEDDHLRRRDDGQESSNGADREIVDALAKVGFDADSYVWRQLSRSLLEYAYPVLVAWGVTGVLAQHAKNRGCRSAARLPDQLYLDDDDARALATEVLIVAIEKFRRQSLRQWDPAGGASLSTFFIGRCLQDLADAYWSWTHREHSRFSAGPPSADDGRHSARPDEEAEARVLVDELLDNDPVLRATFELQQSGYKLAQIVNFLKSADIDVTLLSLQTRIYRFRKQQRGR